MFEIFQYSFMQRAFFAGTLVALIAPLIGMFIVVRRFSALADTLSHVSLIGVSIALLNKLNPINVALITSMIAGLGVEKLRKNKRLYGESVLVLFISASLGISSVILSLAKGTTVSLFSYLFGSINTISVENIFTTFIVSVVVVMTIFIFYSQFFLISFDEELATAQGVRTGALNFILIMLAAITVSVGIQVVGVLLIGALMVIPVMTAMQYQVSFKQTMFFAVLFSVFSVWLGLYSSYILGLATGGTIVIFNLIFFCMSLLVGDKS